LTDYKKDDDKLFPWEDEEGRKCKTERGDSIPPNTGISSRIHSKPKVAGQEYLDMYIMSKEKERIEKYGGTLGKQQKNIAKTWKRVKKELLITENILPKISKAGLDKSKDDSEIKNKQNIKIPKHIKGMDWNY